MDQLRQERDLLLEERDELSSALNSEKERFQQEPTPYTYTLNTKH